MNTCESFSASLSDYVENNVHADQRKFLDLHLAHCPSCHAAVDRLQTLRTHLHSLPRLKTSPDFDTMLRTRLMFERKKTHVLPFFQAFARMPRAASYALASIIIVLVAIAFLRPGQSSQAFAKRAHHEELSIPSTYYTPAGASLEEPPAKTYFLLDNLSPASLSTQREFVPARELKTPPDSSAASRINPTGPQSKPTSF